MAAEPTPHPDCRWYPNGQSVLGGNLLDLDRRLDAAFRRWGAALGAEEHAFPVLIPAAELARLDYFRSFPHLATFAALLDPDEENLRDFQAGETVDDTGALRLTRTAPVRDVLTPAACYHVYVLHAESDLPAPRFVTTRATCFRRESSYAPLERQWSFSMREIVALGTEEEVKAFLARMTGVADGLCRRAGLPIRWQAATDPFFDPGRSPKHLAQVVEPVKTEMVFGEELAIGSVNLHRDVFGEAFGIRRGGAPAWSGCIAFGIERWILAFLTAFGPEPAGWPLTALEED